VSWVDSGIGLSRPKFYKISSVLNKIKLSNIATPKNSLALFLWTHSVLLVTSVSDSRMHTIKLRSGVVVHAAGAVINKIHWCVAVSAVKRHAKCDLLLHRRPGIVDRTSPVIDPKARYWSRNAIFAYPTCIRRPVRGSPSGILPWHLVWKN